MVPTVAREVRRLEYHDIVPDVTEKKSEHDIRKRYLGYLMSGGHQPESLIFRADRYLDMKNAPYSAGAAGRDRSGESFLPWCLMRCAETARILFIDTILVDCDRETWGKLVPSLDLIGTVTGVRLARMAPPGTAALLEKVWSGPFRTEASCP